MLGSPEVSYHQIYSARDWFSILMTPYPNQNLQRKHRTDKLARAVVTLETERFKGSNPWWWWWWWWYYHIEDWVI